MSSSGTATSTAPSSAATNNAGSLLSHRAMSRAVGESGLRPVIEQVLPLAGAIEAIVAAPKSEQFGKVCLQID